MLKKVTPIILTYNEDPNINRTLAELTWARKILVIDSYSTDNTLDMVKKYPQVEIKQRKFDNYADQWNYALEQVSTEWVLSLDADYILSEELISEISNLPEDTFIDGYFIPFKYCVFGKPLRGTLLPSRQALFKRSKAIYQNDGHRQLLKLEGKSDYLSSYIWHDDRKSLSRWLWAQERYMIIEAKKLTETPFQELSLSDKIRKQKILAPFIIFFYCLILKGTFFDGWAGLYYAFQRMLAEILLSIHLIEVEQKVILPD